MSMTTRLLIGFAVGGAALLPGAAGAVTFQTLHAFTDIADGGDPDAGVILDQAGALYGTTSQAGLGDEGTAYRLDPVTKQLTVLHAFGGGADGGSPMAGLVADSAGLLYGTTNAFGAKDYGTVFKLDPATHKLTTLHAFSDGGDGASPTAGLVLDRNGMLYGTTSSGGTYGSGTVFKLDPVTKVLTTLHPFSDGADGGFPTGNLMLDPSGLLYGTTGAGGAHSDGIAFKLDPVTKKLTVLHDFSGGADGSVPVGSLVRDQTGLLYGTTRSGGASGVGVAYRLDPVSRTLVTLHNFSGGNDGANPAAGMVFGLAGLLYGTTYGAGAHGHGTLFELNLGTRKLATLHAFADGADGGEPVDVLAVAPSGTLYGTASGGGAHGAGVVFKLTP